MKFELKKINDISDFLIDVSKVDIDDENLNVIIIKALMNVLKICGHYRMNRNTPLVKKYVGYVKKIREVEDKNDYVINIANTYYKELEIRDNLYKEKPFLATVIINVNELYHEISIQDSRRGITDNLEYLDNKVEEFLN